MCGHEEDGAGVPILTDLPDVDAEYVQLCIDEMNAIADASQELIWESIANGWYEEGAPPEAKGLQDRLRAQLYKKHLDAAGIEIRRIV